MISVLTPSVRPEGLALVQKALRQQTHKDFEWIVGSPFDPGNDTLRIRGSQWIRDTGPRSNEAWSLNRVYNDMIRASRGELVVSWQDFTYARPDTLERLWEHYMREPETLVTAVGNKYQDSTWAVVTWQDPRKRTDQGTFYSCFFNDIEANLCSIPRKALYAVGGFDEVLDAYFGMDAYSVFDRINIIGGFDFKIDQTIESYSLEHGRVDNWEEKNAIHGPYEERRKFYLVANLPLPYLL